VVLVEEELVVTDLQSEGWPLIQTPYLVPLHSSAITCSHHISTTPLKLWDRVIAAGDLQNTLVYKALNGLASYITDSLLFYVPPQAVRSSTAGLLNTLKVPQKKNWGRGFYPLCTETTKKYWWDGLSGHII